MLYARIALVGSAIFGLTIIALHFLEPEFDPMTRAISQYAHGSYGVLMTLAFLAGGVGALALSATLHGISRVGQVCLCIAGIGTLLSAVFQADADGAPDTAIGTIHENVGLCTFISLLVAGIVLTRAFGKNSGWRSFQRLSAVLMPGMVCGFLFVFATNAVDAMDGLFGVAQRFFVGSAILWQFLVAVRANQLAGDQVGHVVIVERAGITR